MDLPDGTTLDILVEGPLLFVNEGEGAHETLLRKGNPTNSAEAKTCLTGGKKLRQAKINFSIGEEVWTFTLDADEFTLRSLSIPRIEEFMDATSNFEERMHRMETCIQALLHTFDHYCELRKDTAQWKKEVKNIHQWVSNRISRY